MPRPLSIGRHLGRHLALLATVLVAIYSLTVDRVYQWGLYDSTHYFLSLEADRVLASLQRSGRLPPATSPDTQYYAEAAQLPPPLLAAFPLTQHRDGELLTAEQGDDVHLLLPYRHPDTGRFFYVAHVYHAAEDVYEAGPTIPQLLLLLALAAVIVVALLVSYLAWSIIRPVRALERWAITLPPGATADEATAPSLTFTELHAVAERLRTTVTTLAEHNQREQHFLRSLSHELRTPLAVIKSALTLLTRQADRLDGSQRRKLELIARANEHMLATTECLLWLWTGTDRPLAKEDVDVGALLADIVQSQHHLLQGKPVTIVSQIPDPLRYHVEPQLFAMLLGNLVRNACQYTEAGAITIRAEATAITIKNPVGAPAAPALAGAIATPADYGYGVGLFLVKTLCARQGWGLHIRQQHDEFAVTVTFFGDDSSN